jgi:hypothetical protein
MSESQWPHGLRHELSLPAQNTGIMDSNPTQGMDVCVCIYSVFVLFCVQVEALRRADPLSKECYRLCKKIKKLKKSSQGPTKGCRAIDIYNIMSN